MWDLVEFLILCNVLDDLLLVGGNQVAVAYQLGEVVGMGDIAIAEFFKLGGQRNVCASIETTQVEVFQVLDAVKCESPSREELLELVLHYAEEFGEGVELDGSREAAADIVDHRHCARTACTAVGGNDVVAQPRY